MDFMSGDLGRQLVLSYVNKLETFPSLQPRLNNSSIALDFFKMVVIQVGESRRRFCYKHDCFPFILWQLCNLQDDALYSRFSELQEVAVRHPCCADIEFTTCLLGHVPRPFDPRDPSHQERVAQVQRFLQDCATYAPVSTEQVEAAHGFMQTKLHRFRGLKPTDEVAREITLWSSVTAAYRSIEKYIWDRAGDHQGARRLAARARGTRITNSFSWEHIRAMALRGSIDHPRLKQKKLCGH